MDRSIDGCSIRNRLFYFILFFFFFRKQPISVGDRSLGELTLHGQLRDRYRTTMATQLEPFHGNEFHVLVTFVAFRFSYLFLFFFSPFEFSTRSRFSTPTFSLCFPISSTLLSLVFFFFFFPPSLRMKFRTRSRPTVKRCIEDGKAK